MLNSNLFPLTQSTHSTIAAEDSHPTRNFTGSICSSEEKCSEFEQLQPHKEENKLILIQSDGLSLVWLGFGRDEVAEEGFNIGSENLELSKSG